MIRRLLLTLVPLLPPALAQVQLQFAPATETANYTQVLPLPNGDRLLAGTRQVLSAVGLDNQAVSQYRLAFYAFSSPAFNLPLNFGGHGNDILRAATFDPNGNLWVVGDTDSDDFTLVNPIISQKLPYRTAAFIMEIDTKAGKLLFATYLAGETPSSLPFYSSHASSITIDAAGNAYVGGYTDEPDFPTTPGAFVAGKGGIDNFYDTFIYSYVVKISPAGKMVYSTLLGTGSSDCIGGSRCIGQQSTYEDVGSMAVDSTGTVTAAGEIGGAWNPGGAYVSRVAPDGSKLLWTFNLPGTLGAIRSIFMAQDSTGNMDLFGQYATVIVFDPSVGPTIGTPGLYAAELKSDGSGLIYSTDLGESPDAIAYGIALDASGNAWMTGSSSAPRFPALAGVPNIGSDFALHLDPTGAAQTLFRFPHGAVTAPPAVDSSGNLLLLGVHQSLLTFPANYAFDQPALVGFANAASFSLSTGIYPGALLTLWGFDLPNPSQGLQVLIDNEPAPILYASPTQINIQVPFDPGGLPGPATIQVGTRLGTISVQTDPRPSVGIFTTDGVHAAALNQDGSVNSPSNPAVVGSIVTIFGTGAYWPTRSPTDTPAPSAFSLDQGGNGFVVLVNEIAANVLYFGSAPGIIEGVFQMNVQLPEEGPVQPTLQIQSETLANSFGNSNVVQIYVQ
jgi:uncharacterized protein (TIGR03437 family)